MRKESTWVRIKNRIERYLPMTLNSLVLMIFLGYLFYVVGQSVYTNYQSNKSIEAGQKEIVDLQNEIEQLENEIAYYNTNSYKERQARAKLGYKAPDEKVVSLNFDQPEDKMVDNGISEAVIKTPNRVLWWSYFTRD